MRLNRTSLVFFTSCAVIAVLLLFNRTDKNNEAPLESAPSTEIRRNPAEQPAVRTNRVAQNSNGLKSPRFDNSVEHTNLDPIAELARRRDDINRGQDEWRTPIEFYGKVVDETDKPISEAGIVFGCTDLSPDGHSTYRAMSNPSGLFSLGGMTGKFLSVRISKAGYYNYPSNPYGFTYAGENVNFKPSSTNPIVFHLRKKSRGESLIAFNKTFPIPRDGSPVSIDLINGILAPNTQGHLQVECRTQVQEKRGTKYDWKCRITVLGGGLQTNEDEFGFLAPTEGYESGDEIDMTVASAVRWQSDVTRSYFVHLANGYYGRLTFRMIVGGDHFCRIEWVLNPSGSQNLEFDESAQPAKPTHFE